MGRGSGTVPTGPRQTLGLPYEQQWCIAQLAVSNVSLPRRRLLGSIALRLPMEQIV